MNIKQIFLECLEKASTDIAIENGIFDISKQEHIEVLREYLLQSNLNPHLINFHLNKMVEGKYPERQAYNANGILVTFPTPEYKQKAIARGTHFEENPRKGQANVFTGDETPEQPSGQQIEFEPPQPKSEPVVSQPEPKQSKTDDRSKEEKEQDAQAIEKALTTEYTIEEAFKFGFYNKKNSWFDSTGKYIGKLWNIGGKQIILK